MHCKQNWITKGTIAEIEQLNTTSKQVIAQQKAEIQAIIVELERVQKRLKKRTQMLNCKPT